MNFENSVHSWSIADCRSSDWSPDPSVSKFQTSTIFGQFELCLNTSSVTPENNCANLKNKIFFVGLALCEFFFWEYQDLFFWIFLDLGIFIPKIFSKLIRFSSQGYWFYILWFGIFSPGIGGLLRLFASRRVIN